MREVNWKQIMVLRWLSAEEFICRFGIHWTLRKTHSRISGYILSIYSIRNTQRRRLTRACHTHTYIRSHRAHACPTLMRFLIFEIKHVFNKRHNPNTVSSRNSMLRQSISMHENTHFIASGENLENDAEQLLVFVVIPLENHDIRLSQHWFIWNLEPVRFNTPFESKVIKYSCMMKKNDSRIVLSGQMERTNVDGLPLRLFTNGSNSAAIEKYTWPIQAPLNVLHDY